MAPPPDRRSRKRRATRESISDAATRLFAQRGFDRVTIDEIAEAADVGRMTVFNHFARKEDMFFDRDEEIRDTLRQTILNRPSGVSPVESLRLLAHSITAEQSPYVEFSANSQAFVRTISESETLRARARAIRDEVSAIIALALAEAAGRDLADPSAHLAASLLLATWTVALVEAHAHFREHGSPAAATALFLALVDQGTTGLRAALAGTPYV